MHEDIKEWWLTMSRRQLVDHLHDRMQYPAPIVNSIVSRVDDIKEARRAAKIKATQAAKLWGNLIDPARAELGIIRTLKSQLKNVEPFDDRKWDALCQYEVQVVKMCEKLRKVERGTAMTPVQFVNHLRKEGKRVPPNNGEHWVDWVRIEDRAAITHLFNGLRPSARGKTKVPFARQIPRKQHTEHLKALRARLVSEQTNAEQEYDMAADPAQRKELDALIQSMHEAQYILDNLNRNVPLPNTWQGVINLRDKVKVKRM